MAFSIDGNVNAINFGGTSQAVSLTTSNTNDVILMVVAGTGGPVVSVTSSNLTFTRRSVTFKVVPSTTLEVWYAISSGTLSSESITVTQTGSSTLVINAFGLSGANTSTPWDTNVSLPAFGNTSATGSTTNANDLLLFCERFSTVGPSLPTGFTSIYSSANLCTAYQIVSSTQTSVTVTDPSGLAQCVSLDALQQGSAVTPSPFIFSTAII